VLFLRDAVLRIQSSKSLIDSFFIECGKVGTQSLWVVSIVSIFTGGVSAMQTTYALSSPIIQDYIIGMVVRDTVFSLIPTLIALVFAGKVGSRISGELGSMKVSEQIDALEIIGVNPVSFLVLPKILASLLMVPVLIVLSIFVSLLSGYLACIGFELISGTDYVAGIRSDFQPFNISIALIKAVTYGFIVSSISSFSGINTQGGALEVGHSNTKAIVKSSIAILVSEYLITNFYGVN
jgi:phospholipid/cholesterol/gamma-HCH transport system permease protein